MEEFDGTSTVTGEIHGLVPMKTEAVPLLSDAKVEAVTVAWVPWRTMSARNREKVHERVMRIIREIEADKERLRELQEVVKTLQVELEEQKSRGGERSAEIRDLVETIKAKFASRD